MSSWAGRGAATRIYSPGFDAEFWALPAGIQARIETKLDELGRQLREFPHHRLQQSDDFRLRVGDYRIIYGFVPPEEPALPLFTRSPKQNLPVTPQFPS